MRRVTIFLALLIIGVGIYLLIKRSIPYSDRTDLLTAEISIDSVWTLGPATGLYDKTTQTYYWLKSYTSLDQSKFDTLKNKKARVRYTKFLGGPLENRISWMEVDSVIVFDQVVERK